MAKFLSFPLLIAFLVFSSCKEEEVVNPVAGTWHLTEILIIDAPEEYQDYIGWSFAPASFDLFAEFIVINLDNNFTLKRNTIEYEPVQIDQNGSISLVWGGRIDTFHGTYEFLDDILTLTFANDPAETYALDQDGTLNREVPLGLLESKWIYRKY